MKREAKATPPPGPLPGAGRGSTRVKPHARHLPDASCEPLSPPPRTGEGVGGWGFFLIPLLLLVPACGPKPGTSTAPEEPKPVPVTVADAKPQTLRRTVPVVGTLFPYEDVMLAPKVGGKVLRVNKDIGDRVAPGELLLEIDPTEYRIAVEHARPAYTAELRRLKLPDLSLTDVAFEAHIEKLDTVVEARANFALAKSEQARIAEGVKNGAESRQALDSAVNRLAVAEARVELALTDARVVLSNARRLKAALDDAERKLADTKLYAPSPAEWDTWLQLFGTTSTPMKYAVAEKRVSVGTQVEAMPVTNSYRLVLDHALKFGAAVPEKYQPEVAVGQTVELRVIAHADKPFTGTVARISPLTDTGTRTFGVVIAVRNGDGRLKAGGFAEADIVVRSETVTTVPPEALVQFAGVNKVFVVNGDKAKVVEVTIGTRDKDWIEVGGLPAGAKVITSGQSQLVEGSPIRVR